MENLENNSNLDDIKPNRSWLFETKIDFAKRWNIDLHDNRFYERCIELVGNIIINSQNLKNLTHQIHLLVGKTDIKREIIIETGITDLTKKINGSKVKFEDTSLYALLCELSNDINFIKFLEALEQIFNDCYKEENKDIINQFNDIAHISNKAVRVVYGNSYKFYPSGIELFDKKLIDDILEFLKKYPQSHKEFTEALTLFIKNGSYRDAIDKTRLALEIFVKQFLDNSESLEKQKRDLGKYLMDNNIHKEIMNMFDKLIDIYSKLNNDNTKHNSGEFKKCEVEFLFYLVGNFRDYKINCVNPNLKP